MERLCNDGILFMKRMLLAATMLVAVQVGTSCTALAQADEAPTQGEASASPAPRHHKHRRHKHQVAVAQAPVAEPDAAPSVVAEQAAPEPAHTVTAQPAMASLRLPDTAAEAQGAGPGLTPTGAIRAGNADGTIPAWTGGLVGERSNKPIRFRPDPFAAERPLFSITAQNVDRYADHLAAGTMAMIRTMRGYRVDVYPSHRTFAAPQFIYDNAVANIGRARLVHNGEGVEGAALSIAFPVPHNGAEAMWNHTLRWRGTQIVRTIDNMISTPGGDYSLQKWHEEIMFPYNTPGFANTRQWDSLFRSEVLGPPRDAGALTLVINHENPYDHDREAWSYNPGERRVRRAPDINYDTPLTDTDGLETVDDYDLFNGPMDRYDWSLVGRREIYVPYNTYKLQDPAIHYASLIGRESIKPEHLRFELHRVWVVEAKLKPEFRHIYSRRTFYLDEDSWQALIADRYDGRGNLWRTAMAFPIEGPEVPLFVADGYEYIDLYQHRYLVQGLHNEEAQAPLYNATSLTLADYTAEALRRMGHR